MAMPRFLASLGAALLATTAISPTPARAAPQHPDRYVILVTLDGLRWQELFRGADDAIIADKAQMGREDWVKQRFVSVPSRPVALMPFLSSIPARGGTLIGNRDAASCMKVANPYWFSYPGYNEMLTGFVDPKMNSNDPVPNPHQTVLEWLNRATAYKGSVRAVATWHAFHAILNEKRSGIPVNAGIDAMAGETPLLKGLAQMQADLPQPWGKDERFDAITQAYARHTQQTWRPRVLFVSYGETDSHAHEGRYDFYLEAAHNNDRFVRELWDAAQADPVTRGKTTLIVTTDHGRGTAVAGKARWHHHGSGLDEQGKAHDDDRWTGSDQSWAAILPAPGLAVAAPARGQCATTGQIAATVAAALGLEYRQAQPKAAPPLLVAK